MHTRRLVACTRPALRHMGAPRRHASSEVASFATLDPDALSGSNSHVVHNLLNGEWVGTAATSVTLDPLNGEEFMRVADTSTDEVRPFVESLNRCSKSGLHNPLKNPDRYLQYGEVSAKAAALLRDKSVEDFFTRLIQRTAPKSDAQARGEVTICRTFLENFGGDQPRFLARSFAVPGDHLGQLSQGFRWPYGPVALITPFNFPLEIPLLQLMGALYMGNKVILKLDSKNSVVMEQCLRLLHSCGMPLTDVDFLNNADGTAMHRLLIDAQPRMTLFTGSSRVAEILARDLHGRIKIEDAGFDWKILGPDVADENYVAWQCDQDAYAYSGQKCSAQSALFMHDNWVVAGLEERLRSLAARRSLDELTVGPVLTVTNERFEAHRDRLLAIPGARVMFGGRTLEGTTIPPCYGAWEPTAVFVPLEEMVRPEHFDACTTEIFGPFQVVTQYNDSTLDLVLEACERMEAHLTAAVVSNDVAFRNHVLGHTVNGTTYCGRRARTTGAPQNHWFGPAGDPRGAGIGSPEAIKLVWSCHREVVQDDGPVPGPWTLPAAT